MNNSSDPLTRPYLDPSWPFQLISELLSIPTLFMVLVLSYQHYKKGFSGTFQKLVYITILNDMWCYYNQMFFLRWPQRGIFGFYLSLSPTIIPAFFGYFALVSICHQHFFLLLIAVNRLHSLYDPMNFTTFWDKHFTKLITFLFILPQPLCIYIIFSQRVYYLQFALNTGYLNSDGMAGAAGKVILFGTLMVVIATVIVNLLAIVKLVTWQNELTYRKGQANTKFHLYSFYTFVVGTLYNITEFGIYVVDYGTFWSKLCTICSNVFLDLFCLSSVWTWLLMSSEARYLVFPRKRKISDVPTFSDENTFRLNKIS